MINLYKVNGQLKARGKLLADYTEVIVSNAKEQWLKDMKAEYDELFPVMRLVTQKEYEEDKELGIITEMPEWDELEYEYKQNLMCPIDYSKHKNYRPFDSWLLETEIVEPSVEEVRNEYGMVETPYKQEVTKLLREFIAPTVTEDMLDEYLKGRYKEIRATEYPRVEDYMDAIVKGDIEAQNEYIAKCLAVKIKYPK